jgi:hypothetical protein
MQRDYGTFYLVPPGWDGQADDAHEHVVDTHRYGPSYIRLAIELARLSGDDPRAERIEKVLERAYERDDAVLDDRDIEGMLAAIDGLEGVAKAALLGADNLIPQDRVADLRSRSKFLDLDEHRGATVAYAGLEALTRISALRHFLEDARARGLHIYMD